MKNKLLSGIGGIAGVIGFYLLATYFYDYLTKRFIPVMKQLVYFFS